MLTDQTEMSSTLLTRPLSKTMKYKRITEIAVILASGLVVFQWLHGEILYFWDQWFPFNPPADVYHFSFTWQQLIGNGVPWTPNCRGLFFPSIYLLHNVLSLSLQASQVAIMYILFTCSGLSMYWLVAYLRRTYQLGKALDFAPISAALVYMFNYYTALYLLSQLWPSWFLYSLLPLSLLVFLDGMKRSESGRVPILNVSALAILFQLMSAGFWQAPYLAYTLFLFFAFFIIYVRGNSVGKKQLKNLAKFLATSSLAVITTGLWWLNTFIVSTAQSIALFTPGTSIQSTQPWMLDLLRKIFTKPEILPFHLVNLIRIYPPLWDVPGNVYTWQTAYSGPYPNPLLVLASIIFTSTVFLPLLAFPFRGDKPRIGSLYAVMYSCIVLLLFFGAQGSNPLASLLFHVLDEAHFPFLGVFYLSQAQFLMFPLVFFYAIGFGEGVACLGNWVARLPKLHRRIHSRRVRHAPQLVAVALILIISVGIYPWYLWTQQATQVYVAAGSQTVPSTTSFPPYLKELTDYLTANAGDSVIYIIPHTGNGLLGMKFNDSGFVDTFDPIRMMAGKPTLVGISEPNPQNALYWEMQDIVYEGFHYVNSFSNLLTAMNVKYILVETNALTPYWALPMNLSLALDFLSKQKDIELVRQFGPLLLYENLKQTKMIYAANITEFNPSISHPLHLFELNLNETKFIKGDPNTSLYNFGNYSYLNGTLNLKYTYKKGESYNFYNFYSTEPLHLDLFLYRYMLITFRTQPNTWFYVYASNDSRRWVGLVPENPTMPSLSPPLIYQNSENYSTLIYPLYNAQNFIGSSELNYIILGLVIAGSQPPSPSMALAQIKNITFAGYIRPELSLYMSSAVFHPDSEVLVSNSTLMPITNFNPPKIIYSELNPTLYKVEVKNATSPYALVFTQNFDRKWQASIDGVPIDSLYHFGANGYANAWYITREGDYTITLTYLPQESYDRMVVASVFSVIALIAITIFDVVRRRLHKHIPTVENPRLRY